MKKLLIFVLFLTICLSFADEEEKLSLYAKTGLISDPVLRSGYTLSPGIASGNLIELSYGMVSGIVSSYTTVENEKYRGQKELSSGVFFNLPARETNLGIFVWDIGIMNWNYLESERNRLVLETSLSYIGVFDLKIELAKFIGGYLARDHQDVYVHLGKTLTVDGVEAQFFVLSAYLDNTYGIEGVSHITPGFKIDYDLNSFFTIGTSFKHQFALLNEMDHLFQVKISLSFEY